MTDSNVYAAGSGSITADRDGNPEIIAGAIVLVGRHRRLTMISLLQDEMNWDDEMDVFVGRRCKVLSTYPADESEPCRTFCINDGGDGYSPRGSGTSYEFRCRDAVLLRTAAGLKTRYELALEAARDDRMQFEATFGSRAWLSSWARHTGLIDDHDYVDPYVLHRMLTLFECDAKPEAVHNDPVTNCVDCGRPLREARYGTAKCFLSYRFDSDGVRNPEGVWCGDCAAIRNGESGDRITIRLTLKEEPVPPLITDWIRKVPI